MVENPIDKRLNQSAAPISNIDNNEAKLQRKKSKGFYIFLFLACSISLVLLTSCIDYSKIMQDSSPTRFASPNACESQSAENYEVAQNKVRQNKFINAFRRIFKKRKNKQTTKIKRYVPSLPTNYKYILSQLDARVSKVPDIKERARKVHWPIDEGNLRRWLDLSKWKLEYHNIPLEQYVWDSVEWRESYNTCCIPNSDVHKFLATPKMYVSGKDRLGRPLVVIKIALEEIFDVTQTQRLLIYTVERAIKMMEDPTEQFSVIIDCEGISFKSIPPASYMTQLFKVLMANYPLRLGIIFVLNASRPINILWKIVSPICTERTRKKVHFLSSEEIPDLLLEYISPEEIEPQWGGKAMQAYNRDSYLSAHKPRRRLQ